MSGNSSLSKTDIFLALDGPRDERDAQAVSECKKSFDQFSQGFGKASKLYSGTNKGLRTKVIESVTEAFKTVDNLPALEDDCLIRESSLDFFNWGFERLNSKDDIGVISRTFLGSTESNKAFLTTRFSPGSGKQTNKLDRGVL